MSLTRRTALSLGAVALAAPAVAIGVTEPRAAAPSSSDIQAWSDYEVRLRNRLADAGGGKFDETTARAVLELTNQARQATGAQALVWHTELAGAACAHAGDLAHRHYIDHLSPEGFDPSHRFWLTGRTTVGSPSENIAYHRGEGPPITAPGLLRNWRNSPRHWGNLLNPRHSHGGIGLVRTADRAWLVGLYAQPLATLSEPLAFRPEGDAINRALQGLSPVLLPRLTRPQGSLAGIDTASRSIRQIAAVRRVGLGAFDLIGGPIFLANA